MPAVRPHPQRPLPAPPAIACPRCGGVVDRVPRHFADRLLSLVAAVHRFRCRRFDCQWEGVMRPAPAARSRRR